MILIYHDITLPVDAEQTFEYVSIKQGDAGTHKIRASLVCSNRLYAIPSGLEYALHFRKPDGEGITVPAQVEDNRIVAELSGEMLDVSGNGRAEFVIRNQSDELKTATIYVKIMPTVSERGGLT